MHSNDIKYSQSHEWVKIENDTAIVGISNHAQELLGDIVYVELPQIEQNIIKNDTVGVIESVKAASDIYSPISGEVIAINDQIINDPTIINKTPESDGWLFKVKYNDITEVDSLMNLNDYKRDIGK
ncbi:MAG TPA: glycine cleavage system protein GcvH [Burkholderiales bacterium]|nr:glycine cleavage system protein GcvH [Burkholderiales bacterium]